MKTRHHTVPKCYLKNFSNEDGFVWVLTIDDKVFKTNPLNILVENNFYTVTLKNGKKSLVVEDTLANIEGAFASIYENKISKDLFLSDEERARVSIFLAALLSRTKPRREGMRKMLLQLKNNMIEWKKQFESMPKNSRNPVSSMLSSDEPSINLEELEESLENFDEGHSKMIIPILPETAQLIFDMKWSVLKNTKTGFVTSDNPLVLLRPESIKKYGAKAIGSHPGLIWKDVELTIPLSKERLLLAGWILEEDSYLSISDESAVKMNHRTITSSSERIITDKEERANMIRDVYNKK